MAPKTAWIAPGPAIHNDSVESKTPLRQLRSRGNEFHIGTLFLFSRWLDEMLHGVIPYERFQLFRFTHPFTPLVKKQVVVVVEEAETQKRGRET